MMPQVLSTAAEYVKAPLIYKGKVRELYDLGEQLLVVVTDRISAFDYVLEPPVPYKGITLNQMSLNWFKLTTPIIPNHVLHADLERLSGILTDQAALRDRFMVVKKAERIPVECVVRGYLAGDGWRQYAASSQVNGHALPAGLRKNERLVTPIFTPAKKNDIGHDENITTAELEAMVGSKLAQQLEQISLSLYSFAGKYCEQHGIILADSKFEFGILNDEVILIDEVFTPDSSRFWAKDRYALDIEMESFDKEPVRKYLAESSWDRNSVPDPLPAAVVEATSRRYQAIRERLFPES